MDFIQQGQVTSYFNSNILKSSNRQQKFLLLENMFLKVRFFDRRLPELS